MSRGRFFGLPLRALALKVAQLVVSIYGAGLVGSWFVPGAIVLLGDRTHGLSEVKVDRYGFPVVPPWIGSYGPRLSANGVSGLGVLLVLIFIWIGLKLGDRLWAYLVLRWRWMTQEQLQQYYRMEAP